MNNQETMTMSKFLAWVGAAVVIMFAIFFHALAARQSDGSKRRHGRRR
jgi:hypothetical protein